MAGLYLNLNLGELDEFLPSELVVCINPEQDKLLTSRNDILVKT